MSERQRPQSKVSVEGLLRLKRAERPASEFWTEFDGQLRRKQLAAIVDKRPWWRRVSVANLAKLTLPAGATAILALAVINVRERTQPVPGLESVASTNLSSPVSVSATTTIRPAGESSGTPLLAVADQEQSAPTTHTTSRDAAVASDSATVLTPHAITGDIVASRDAAEQSLAQVILGLEGTMESDARPSYQPASEMPILASLDSMQNSSAPVVTTTQSDSFMQVSAPRNDRRARLLASLDSQDRSDMVSGNSRVARSRERIANRLAEQSLYDSISRLGLNGDSVSIKF
jgi:hypothetical protein